MTRNDRAKFTQLKSDIEFAEGHVAPEFKAQQDGTIEGYASVFGVVDKGLDVVERGAFAETLAAGNKVKMLWQHDPHNPIGVWDEVKEDEKGLYVKGRILSEVEKGREAAALVKEGAIDGLSIGYRTKRARNTMREERTVRVIENLELWEVSLVTFPMLPDATIDAYKAAQMSRREFERQLLRESKMSRSVVSALMRGGFEEVQALSDSGDDDYSELLDAIYASSLSEHL